MHVIATAGHVDHGKSTLVKALTGSDPDRLQEERRRGLTIALGYCWTTLPGVDDSAAPDKAPEDVAFVDVPGHERFIATMLSGIGPVPAVLFVVAADDPWMPQAAEHLAALDALGVTHGVVAVTRSDLADPGPASLRVADELSRTSLAGAPVVPVSARTGTGLDELRARLAAMLRGVPQPDRAADVRLWVDRRFTVRGAGTVVTGTLPAGTIRRGDLLEYAGRSVRVRGVQTLERPVDEVYGVARVALNLAGDDLAGLDRGDPLLTPGAWRTTEIVDVRLRGSDAAPPPDRPLLHLGAASVATYCRPLGDDLVRLTLDRPLPLRIGDRALLRDPGDRRIWGVQVLDPAPPLLNRRGASSRRAAALADHCGEPDLVSELLRREVVSADLLRRIGVPLGSAGAPSSSAGHADPPIGVVDPTTGVVASDVVAAGVVIAGGWLMSPGRAERAGADLAVAVREHDTTTPLDPGLPLTVLADRIGLPSPELVAAAVLPPLLVRNGRVIDPGLRHDQSDGQGPGQGEEGGEEGGEERGEGQRLGRLPAAVESAVDALHRDLAEAPFAAPTAGRLAELGLDNRSVAAAAKGGRLLRLAPGIVLLPGAEQQAITWLSELPQPFTASEARERLNTSRRVVLPLLDHLDRSGLTRRLPDDRRVVREVR